MKKLIVLALAGLLLVGAATAKDTYQARRLTDDEIASLQPVARQDCMLGNLNPAAWALTGWATGFEAYKLLFNPSDQCPNCPMGFLIENVHMLLQFPVEGTILYPYVFTVYVDLEDAFWWDDIGCWWPGVEDCVSDPIQITIDAPGLYDISVPLPCECAYFRDATGMPYWYLISFHFVDEMLGTIITDDFPTACTSFNDWGSGWVDLLEYGFPGNLIMWADAVCCEDPIDAEAKSLGEIKNLFR